LRGQGFEFRLGTQVREARVARKKVRVTVAGQDREEILTFDRLLVSVGRCPLTQGLGLENLGIRTDPRSGRIPVDESYQTQVPGIYAIGDLVSGPMLAHKASAEGIAAVENMAGRHGEVNYDTIPAVVYTAPEVASVGLTEEQVKERQIPFCVGTYPFTAEIPVHAARTRYRPFSTALNLATFSVICGRSDEPNQESFEMLIIKFETGPA